MSLSKGVAGEDYFRADNLQPYKPKSGYTAAVGDFVTRDTSVQKGVDRTLVDTNPFGLVVSINSTNGTLSVAELKDGVVSIHEYTGTAPTMWQKVEANGDRGVILPGKDRMRLDNTNGRGEVIGVDATSPAGTGTIVVRWP